MRQQRKNSAPDIFCVRKIQAEAVLAIVIKPVQGETMMERTHPRKCIVLTALRCGVQAFAMMDNAI
jgi:hypothetical protein